MGKDDGIHFVWVKGTVEVPLVTLLPPALEKTTLQE
jgi:hypothetical protein